MTSLEYGILSVCYEPINKSEAYRRVRKEFKIKISNRDFLIKVKDMLDMRYLIDVSKNKHEFLIQTSRTDDLRTWQSVFDYQKEFLNEAVKKLSSRKILLKSYKSKTNPKNLPTYMPVKEASEALAHFNLAIDYLMINQVRMKYMANFGMMKKSIAEELIKKTDGAIKAGINKLFTDHPKEVMKIRYFARQINRSFDNLTI